MTEPAPTYNRSLGLARLAVLFLLLLGLLWFARPTALSIGIGFVFVALGEAIRFWSAGHLHKTVELITSGPYRYTRNPLYLGRLLILTGLCIATTLPLYANFVVLVLGWAIFFGYYLPRKERVEPTRLAELHGAPYARYRSAVPALFPRLTPWPDGNRGGWSWARLRRNREHWMVIGLVVAFVFLLFRADAFPWMQG